MPASRPAALRSSRARRAPPWAWPGDADGRQTRLRAPLAQPGHQFSPARRIRGKASPSLPAWPGPVLSRDMATPARGGGGGTSPLRPRRRRARSSAASKTTASSGARSQIKVTTQSAADVCPLHGAAVAIDGQSCHPSRFHEPSDHKLPGLGAGPGGTVGHVVTAFVLIDAEPSRVGQLAQEVAAVEGWRRRTRWPVTPISSPWSGCGRWKSWLRWSPAAAQPGRRHRYPYPGGVPSYSRKDLETIWELGALGGRPLEARDRYFPEAPVRLAATVARTIALVGRSA